jgi:hypothetical protein
MDRCISETSNASIDTSGSIYIKYLPKDKLLWELWSHAKLAQYMQLCPELSPELTQSDAMRDINFMIHNNRNIELTTYYGRLLFVDITDDTFDAFTYDMYNGRGTAKDITDKLKIAELRRTICKYYMFH